MMSVFKQKDWYLIMGEEVEKFSQSCQGLANSQKRRGLFRHLRCKKYNIICLHDIQIQESLVLFVEAKWGFDAYFSTFSNNSLCVMVLLKKTKQKKKQKKTNKKNKNKQTLNIQ